MCRFLSTRLWEARATTEVKIPRAVLASCRLRLQSLRQWALVRSLNKTLPLALVVILLGGRLVWMYVIPAWTAIVTDFPNYYVSAWAVRHDGNLSQLYDPVWFEREKHRSGIERPAALFNYFPPMNALIMWPLAELSPIKAKQAWTIINLIALAAVVALTAKASGNGWLPSAAVAFLGLDALGNNMTYGQFYIVLTLLMLTAVLIAERFPSIAGIATAVGTLTKIFPAFLLVYFMIRRKYRALIYSAAAITILIVIGVFVLGWAPHRVYLAEVLGRSLRGEIQDPYNVHWNTLQALLRRALVREETLNPAPICGCGVAVLFLTPRRFGDDCRDDVVCACRGKAAEYSGGVWSDYRDGVADHTQPGQLPSILVLPCCCRWNRASEAPWRRLFSCWHLCANMLERHGRNGWIR